MGQCALERFALLPIISDAIAERLRLSLRVLANINFQGRVERGRVKPMSAEIGGAR